MGNRPVQSRTKFRVLSTWGLGSGLVSQVPCLGDAIVVVGKKRNKIQVHEIKKVGSLRSTILYLAL